jgi:hypothetical protein
VTNRGIAPNRSVRAPQSWQSRIRASAPIWLPAAAALLSGLIWSRYSAAVSGDLAAQWAWADFVRRHPGSAYDLAWYGGIHPASYSLLALYLMAFLGVRTVAVIAGTVSAALLGLLVTRAGLRRPMPVVLWGAFALCCNIAAGRVTFAVGCAFGLAAVAVAVRTESAGWRRSAAVAVLALLAAAASPVAGLFVEVAAAALLVGGRRRIGWALALPLPLVTAATSLLFPFIGVDPISAPTAIYSAGTAAAVALLSPARWRTVRIGAAVYALGAALTLVLPTPVGSNVQRLALIFGSVLVLAALCSGAVTSTRRMVALILVFAATSYWTATANIVGIPKGSPPRLAGALLAELRLRHADAGRIEAVPMLNHWESWALTDAVDLARGWNRQQDVQRNPLFYDGTLDATTYHAWIQHWAVRYVVLPAGEIDKFGRAEAALIRDSPDWLTEVWHDDSWRLFEVRDADPLASPTATIRHATAAEVSLTVLTPGPVTIRIPWSPWLSAHGPAGACLAQEGDWIRLVAPAAGDYVIDADYHWPRGTPC